MIPGVAGVRPNQDLGVRESTHAGSVAQGLGFPLNAAVLTHPVQGSGHLMRLPILTPRTSSWSPSPLEATSVSSQGAGRGHGPAARGWHPALTGEEGLVSWSTSHVFCI